MKKESEMIVDMCISLAMKAKIKPAEFVKMYTVDTKEKENYKNKMVLESVKLLTNKK
jgi:hypothetical protein